MSSGLKISRAVMLLLATGFPLLEAPLTEATQRLMSLAR